MGKIVGRLLDDIKATCRSPGSLMSPKNPP